MKKGMNIGAGPIHLDNLNGIEWENSDFADTESSKSWKLEKLRDFTMPMYDVEDNSIDYILAWHIIEHVGLHEKDAIIKEWQRILKPGGKLFIACPDIVEIAKKIVSGTTPWNDPFIRAVNIYGPYNGFVGDYHKWGYDQETMKHLLTDGIPQFNVIGLGFAEATGLNPGILASQIGIENANKVGFADYNVQLEARK